MQILRRLESLCRREHDATVELIETLVTCQRTRAYADAGYDSVWKLLVERLGYSPAAASRRVAAMRCVMKCPRALDMLRARRTTLSALHTVAKTLCASDDPDTVLDAIDGATQVEVERVVARHRPVVRTVERVRRKAVKKPGERGTSPTVSRTGSARSDSAANADLFADDAHVAVATEATEERVQLTFSLSAADHERLEAAKRRLSSKYPEGMTTEQLFLELLALHETKSGSKEAVGKGKEREATSNRRAAEAAAATPTSAAEPARRSRRVPAATRREVFGRDGHRCTFVAADGTRCTSRHDLEIDHVVPWALGGTHEPSNLRVLCAVHNRRRAEVTFGSQNRRRRE